MKLKRILLAAACAAFISSSAHAILDLRLNTTTKEFAIFGSDTGMPDNIGDGGVTAFQLTSLGGSGFGSYVYSNDVAYSTSVGTPGNPEYAFDFGVLSTTSNGGRVYIEFATSSSASQTITGNEAFQDYGSIPADAIARIESAIGQSLSLDLGSGFSPMSVTAVPEPSTYAALGGIAALAFVMYRRRKV